MATVFRSLLVSGRMSFEPQRSSPTRRTPSATYSSCSSHTVPDGQYRTEQEHDGTEEIWTDIISQVLAEIISRRSVSI